MAVIQIRGTSGSGKTWVMKQVMAGFEWTPVFNTGRKKPWYYFSRVGTKMLIVLGHYEIACGGCDTIGSAKAVYELTRCLLDAGNGDRIILQEGLLLSEDAIWTQTYGNDVKSVFLTGTIEDCLERVKDRQDEKGREPINQARVREKLESRLHRIEKIRQRLVLSGICCRRAPAEQAVKIIQGWIQECTT